MKNHDKMQLTEPGESVKLNKPLGRAGFRIFAFLICFAVLVAAFAVSGIWTGLSTPVKTFFEGIWKRERVETEIPLPESFFDTDTTVDEEENLTPPVDAIPILSQTLFEPERLATGEEFEMLFQTAEKAPFVLVYCADPYEAYLAEPLPWLEGDIGDVTFSQNEEQTVVTVAKILCRTLNAQGIPAIYAQPETENGVLYNSTKAAEFLEAKMREYPQISLVINVGRDSFFDSRGNYIKTISKGTVPTAQALAIVGSDASGVPFSTWRNNLALCELLQMRIEKNNEGVFRGIRIKSTPQNQQYSPFALSLAIGTGANTVKEAIKTAELIGESLSSILKTE